MGLFLAIALRHHEIECVVLEKRTDRITHSRSLGIHPVSLELMEKVGLVDAFLKEGVKIKRGIAFAGKRKIGTISFSNCPEPYTYVLSVPQYKTETLLEMHLADLRADCLVRGAAVQAVERQPDSVEVTYSRNGKRHKLNCRFLVGCDGKNSTVRKAAGFAFNGDSYPDTYIMGDYTDNTVFESDAAVFLCREGLIESFPLGNNHRRWVVKTEEFIRYVTRTAMEKRVASRIGHDIGEEKNFMLSSFGVQKYISEPMADGRIYLAGDAAHIVSPIGGQGMNLGWLDAWDLGMRLRKLVEGDSAISADTAARNYSRKRTEVARQAIRRAELNMALGRKHTIPFIKNALVWLMLNTPLSGLMARIFTMRGLGRWPV